MEAYIILISLILIEAAISMKLLIPTKKCVPTATITGACHVCVCHTDGVYHCREEICQPEIGNADPDELECEPNELYREDTTFCSCSALGFWKSTNCSDRFQKLLLIKNPIKKYIKTDISCTPNSFYITECNVCQCKASGFITYESCTTRPCPKRNKGDYCNAGDVYRSANEFCLCGIVNYYLDRLCLKVVDDVMQAIPVKDLARIIDVCKTYVSINENKCKENLSIVKDCNTCTCYKNKFICTSKDCYDNKEGLRSLVGPTKPLMLELKSADETCVPGKKYKLKCNTCLCNNINEPVCTSMLCSQDLVADLSDIRKMIKAY